MSPLMIDRLCNAFLDTLLMVGASAFVALLAGIPLAVFLVLSAPGGLIHAPRANRVLGAIINGFRATPFIVLLVALLPFTRLVTGHDHRRLGCGGATFDQCNTVFCPYRRGQFAGGGSLIEAAQAIGCHRGHIIRHVLLPEALPGLVGGFTITIVSMIGASAMAGAVGAGGLGDVAIRYRYQRFDTMVMRVVIAILIAIVCLVQFVGDLAVRRLRAR